METLRKLTRPLRRRITRWGGRFRHWQRPPEPPAPLSRRAAALPATYKHDVKLRRLESGCVVLPDGTARVLYEVRGMALASRTADEAEGFLRDLAGLLNALRPAGVHMIARSRPGGFTRHLDERERGALALDDPARRALGAAQVGHYRRMAANGDARALAFYLVVPAKNPRSAAAEQKAYETLFGQIGLPLRHVAEPEQSLVLAEWWRGDVPTHWYYRLGDSAINVAPHDAKVTR